MASAQFTMDQRLTAEALLPTRQDFDEVSRAKFGDISQAGPMPRLWHRLGYISPDHYYEATVSKLVVAGSSWLDVGCGHDIFPYNRRHAEAVARRCSFVMGVDPDAAIESNPFLHERQRATIENIETDRTFDLVTMRMVAEHITHPQRAIAALHRVTRAGGKVVLFTVNRWSPASIAAALTPMSWHHFAKRLLWRSREEDTFPVAYRLNTRRQLAREFGAAGFREVAFQYLDDCRMFHRYWPIHRLDLAFWQMCRRLRLRHPENCLLGVYERR
jgi:2-polyprenyl-3-methyl-5-hydroxy-6-metoxy-1,4-benzoquinol methylase